MDVVISWSKPQSRAVARALHDWLPKVIPGVHPWMSSEDIPKGKDWFAEIHSTLGDAKLCIICITSENVRSPWIYYEAGAIATKAGSLLICPYLIGIGNEILADGPLARFQSTLATKKETLGLIRSFNQYALGSKHDLTLLSGNFDTQWPALEEVLREAADMEPPEETDFRIKLEAAGVDLALVNVEQSEGTVTVSPKKFLGDLWGPINDSMRELGGTWIRDGRNSRWEITLEDTED